MTKPLDGLKVLDLTWVVAGPVVTRALADFGATVVRVESTTRVETARLMHPFAGGKFSTEGSALYGTWNAGKLGITLNLQEPSARDVVRDLARWADVVLEAFSPGTMDKWGLSYADLSKDHEDLIMISSTIYGQTGPYSKLAGYGNVGAALSGFQQIVGDPDRLPLGPYGPYTDFVGPRFALTTLLAAIDQREDTGVGCYIDVSQVEVGVFFQSPEIVANFAEGFVATRMGNADREFAPHGVYRALDETVDGHTRKRWVAIAITTDKQWQAFAGWLGDSALGTDPELATAAGRRDRAEELDAKISAIMGNKVGLDVEHGLQAIGVPAHVAADSRDFVTDEQLNFRGHLVKLPHPLFGETTVEGPRYVLSDTPGSPERAAPTFGQDTDLVLTSILHYDESHVAELSEAGALK